LRVRNKQQKWHPMQLGEIFREIRREQNRTLEDVAFAAETDAGNLSRIERGQQRYSSDLLERIATALGLSVSALYARLEQDPARVPSPRVVPKRIKKPLPVNEVLQTRFDRLSPDHQAIALDFLQLLLRQQTGATDGQP
jgi:transcriptional regulator with XRE-family HTH domain